MTRGRSTVPEIPVRRRPKVDIIGKTYRLLSLLSDLFPSLALLLLRLMSTSSMMSAHGECYFVSGSTQGVRVWRAEDGQLMAKMTAEHVRCVASSKDGKWIAAGTSWGEVMVWDAKTYKQTFTWKTDDVVTGLDFSPDATHLVTIADHTATVWNIATRGRAVGPLRHEDRVIAAKYSPKGDRIVTATKKSVRVYDSSNGRSLVPDINAKVASQFSPGPLWCNDHLIITSDSKIMQIDASTGLEVEVPEWTAPDINNPLCITISKHGEFIAYSEKCTVRFWDTSTHTERSHRHPGAIHSIALSPDGRFLAIGGEHEEIAIKRLSRITEPDFQIEDTVLNSRKQDQLANAEKSLTAVLDPQNPSHHLLASLALVRARLGLWDEAIADANQSIEIQPSVLAYIAKGVAHVGKGERHKGYRACDIAFEHSHSTHVSFLLLIKAVVVCMAGEHDDAISRVEDLIATLHSNSVCHVVQAYMHFLLGNALVESGDYEAAIQSFNDAGEKPRHDSSQALSLVSLISGWKFDDLDIMIRLRHCAALYAAGRTSEAAESLLNIINSTDDEVYMREHITTSVTNLLQRYLSTPESSGNATSQSPQDDNITLLFEQWAKLKLTRGSWTDALDSTIGFMASRFTIYQTICIQLDTLNKITDATECFHAMTRVLGGGTNLPAEQAKWVFGFKQDLSRKLLYLGDAAMHDRRHADAISVYSAVLSLDLASPQDVLINRSKAYVARGLWENGLQDANKVIALDPSSPWGYERKHAALHRAGRFNDAIDTFETMLMKISQSPHLEIRERRREYIYQGQTKASIRAAIEDAIRESPLVLINTDTGRLLDKSEQASAFETQPMFRELISSMTTHVDHARIKHEVAEYYRYATFSHKWEDKEPLFEKVIHVVVYELEESFTHSKLQMFCKIVREAGYHWAWSDTCCINKADHFVLEEAMASMFKWYEGSALTIVLLRGVRFPSRRGDLMRSIWNTRAWTFQEYHASKVVRFYTEDWKSYLNPDIPNHKESPEIISEMKEATGVSARALMALRPGLDDIREKLRLASTRQTTRVEDAAYSLLGIFSMSLRVAYGDGDKALGRLLAQLLMSSGDTSILAWTGKSATFNSCLPAEITVFNPPPITHIPLTIEGAETDKITTRSRSLSLNSTSIRLYDRLRELPVPSFSGIRMKLPCLAFRLGRLLASSSSSGHVFRAQTAALGEVKIGTEEDLSHLGSLYLVHPWIDFLLDHQPESAAKTIIEENNNVRPSSMIVESPSFAGPCGQTRAAQLVARIGRQFGGLPATFPPDAAPLRPPSSVSQADKQMQALQVLARLRQPFGALLLTPHLGYPRGAYRRVAAESLITVQVEEFTSAILNSLIESVCTLDVV